VTEEKRDLGPDMIADGWHVIGGDWIMWTHAPTHRAVCVDGLFKWSQTRRIPHWGCEKPLPDDEGYVVSCRVFDDLGNPTSGNSFFVKSYALAIRLGRRIREDILAERPINTSEQLTLDDVRSTS
jgi:hypothetical protein